MKIRLSELRKIIREEVSRTLLEDATSQQQTVDKKYMGWVDLIKHFLSNPAKAAKYAKIWDDMVAAVQEAAAERSLSDFDARDIASDVANANEDPGMLSTLQPEVRKLIKDPDCASGKCPTGATLMAAAKQAFEAEEQLARAERPLEKSKSPTTISGQDELGDFTVVVNPDGTKGPKKYTRLRPD